MSKENVEIVSSIYARWARGDFSAAEWADPDIEFVGAEGTQGRGTEVMANAWRDWLRSVEDFAVEPERFLDAGGDRVLVIARFRGRGKRSGAPVEDFPGASLFTLKASKVVRLVLYGNTQDALKAVGLSE